MKAIALVAALKTAAAGGNFDGRFVYLHSQLPDEEAELAPGGDVVARKHFEATLTMCRRAATL
jgi:hypothetical protein